MIHINSVTILNYRSFRSSGNRLTNLQSINVLVGKNNVGKTNVLRAIYLFFNSDTYDVSSDRNIIKQLTGGQSKDPRIYIEFEDDEMFPGRTVKYSILCDLNNGKKEQRYSITSKDDQVAKKLDSSVKIKNYILGRVKCIYLSTTDEDIEEQTNSLINDLILKYFKKQSKEIQKTIDKFEEQYKELMKTFENNIDSIEASLANQFGGMRDMGITPKLSINSSKEITGFLLENIKLQLDDSYVQDIGNKGAGVQRASLIMLSLFLLNEIYSRENKVILLDEPEAFLYPLLVKKVKGVLEENVKGTNNFQMFLTSHSRDFLKEINNPIYCFHYIKQLKEEKEYQRSKNGIEINKYSVIETFSRQNKYEVLKNYGLLDDIDDYEYVIVCEGETDKNYLLEILKDKSDIPQIRYGKYADIGNGSEVSIDYKYVGKGASSIIPILIYLDRISEIPRKVFVLLDGDQAGSEVAKKIHPNEFEHLDLMVVQTGKDKQIEDEVYTKQNYADRVLSCESQLAGFADTFRSVIAETNDSVIVQTENFIKGNNIKNTHIEKIKMLISQNLDETVIQRDWIIDKLNSFFYS